MKSIPSNFGRRQLLLREKPAAVGLSAPGMPIGAPGIDTPACNGKKDPYNEMLVAKSGNVSIHQEYKGNNL